MLEPYAAETALILRKPLFYLMQECKTKNDLNMRAQPMLFTHQLAIEFN
jgi:hypothetical protein